MTMCYSGDVEGEKIKRGRRERGRKYQERRERGERREGREERERVSLDTVKIDVRS